MNDRLRHTLCDLVAVQGNVLRDDPKQFESLLWLAAGEDTRGMFALVHALDQRIPHALISLTGDWQAPGVVEQLARRLIDRVGVAEAEARWAVQAWAEAMAPVRVQLQKAPAPSPTAATPFPQAPLPPASPFQYSAVPLPGNAEGRIGNSPHESSPAALPQTQTPGEPLWSPTRKSPWVSEEPIL